ncbi:MAG TPA: NAD-dependent epimerase/dehydratase family protein [Flavobacterium sp.]|jgi:nucleoside-diphosphate-sugar epimerase
MILITGATGLIGSHLALHLIESGALIRALYRQKASIEKTRRLFELYSKSHLFDHIDWVEADINDITSLELAFKDVTEVYHCAALISFDPADEERLRKTNIEGTANIVNFCLSFKIKKLCHVSSVAALGDLKDYESVVTEETEWNPEKPHGDYAISKYGAEMEIWRGQQEGLNAVIVNPGIVLGAGFWESGSGEVFSRVKNGLLFYTRGTAGFVFVWDVVKIIKLLMNTDLSADRFTVVAETMTYENVLRQVASALHVAPPKIYAKPWLTSIGWKVDWIMAKIGFKRHITKDDARALHSQAVFSNEKIKNVLSFTFTPINEAIKEIVDLQQGH